MGLKQISDLTIAIQEFYALLQGALCHWCKELEKRMPWAILPKWILGCFAGILVECLHIHDPGLYVFCASNTGT
jgi:hypothetical protein